MKFLYSFFVSLLQGVMKVGAAFNSKMKRGWIGRSETLSKVQSVLSPSDKVIWMHAASLGEYEQGVPVLEKLKNQYPDYKILISFFSPSGYENVIKKENVGDVVCYLPFDKKSEIKKMVSCFKTEIFFTVKYDYWYHLLNELKQQGAKIYVVSAYFYKSQIFFKPFGSWFVNQLKKNVDWFFHQTQESEILAKSIGLVQSSTSGDTRFDRVKYNLERDNEVPLIRDFKKGRTTLVFGSSWEAEERIANALLLKHREIKLIIAPHDLKRLPHLREVFPRAVFYSELNTIHREDFDAQVLIIDCIGLLSKLYSYADLAVVGGGFHSKGLHNILEAAVFGIPVFFGNHYKKNPEADALIEKNGAKSFNDSYYAAKYISEVLHNPDIIKLMGMHAQSFVRSQPDAAEMVRLRISLDMENN